jgi:hypothetical protein
MNDKKYTSCIQKIATELGEDKNRVKKIIDDKYQKDKIFKLIVQIKTVTR